MNYRSLTRFKGIELILMGIIIMVIGILLDVYWTEQYWANKPPYSTGPILVGTAGLFLILPVGLLILISGSFVIVYASK
ncbi:MAG: hypothetical protein ACFFCP_07435 [Promethearchaeota archaeon]